MKVCIICFDFTKPNIRLQPWRYIYEISNKLKSMKVDVEIITNKTKTFKDKIDDPSVCYLEKFRSFPFTKNHKLIKTINEKSPDIIIWIIGPCSYYLIQTFKFIDKPIIGIWMTTIYSAKQIIDLGIEEIIRNFDSIILHIVNSLTPNFIKMSILRRPIFKKLIVLNHNTKKLIESATDIEISVIPPGISNNDLQLPEIFAIEKLKEKMTLKGNFVVLYLGSPKSIRGIDILIDAISIVHEKIPKLRLIILSRRHMNDFIKEETYLRNLCQEKQIDKCVDIISGFLNNEDIKQFILSSDVIALPFKLVQSDTPISILEVMALGKPVISTRLDGIPELLENGRGYVIDPNNRKDLAKALLRLYYNPQMRLDMGEKARGYMIKYNTWDDTTTTVMTLINKQFNIRS